MKKLMLISILFFVGCMPMTYSNLQSAKMLDKEEFEITPSISKSLFSTGIGLQVSYGINHKYNLRGRLEKIIHKIPDDLANDMGCHNCDNAPAILNHFSFGFKFPLVRDKSAFYLPISITKLPPETSDITISSGKNLVRKNDVILMFEPTYLYTFSYKSIDFHNSIKALYFIDSPKNFLLALNLGFDLNRNSSKYIFRPELGILTNLTFEGFFPQASIGVEINLN